MLKSELFTVAIKDGMNYISEAGAMHKISLIDFGNEEVLKVFICPAGVLVYTFDGIECVHYYIDLNKFENLTECTSINKLYKSLEVF